MRCLNAGDITVPQCWPISQAVTEPRPGRILVESGGGTTFTVQPQGAGCPVRFYGVLDASGIGGLVTRLFAPRLLEPLYADELEPATYT